MISLKLFIYYASYAYFIVAPCLIWLLLRRQGKFSRPIIKLAMVSFLTVISVVAWARFVEPRILLSKEHEITLCSAERGMLRVGVVADPQIGLFPNVMPISRIVRRVNDLKPDILLLPGDFTYHLTPAKMADTFAPLKDLAMPAYAVMGNHDEGIPNGPDLTDELISVLTSMGVTVLDGATEDLGHHGDTIRIVGMTDLWTAQRDQLPVVPKLPSSPADLTIYLQHNPEAFIRRKRLADFDLMVSGHTHGGQINLPWLTCKLTYACRVQRYGYRKSGGGNLFVSSGTGMGGLPMRFNVPPVVDVLNISYAPCGRNT